jgi:hypothetical protein
MNAALAAEGKIFPQERLFPKPVQPAHTRSKCGGLKSLRENWKETADPSTTLSAHYQRTLYEGHGFSRAGHDGVDEGANLLYGFSSELLKSIPQRLKLKSK